MGILFNKYLLNVSVNGTIAGTKRDEKMNEALSSTSRNLQDIFTAHYSAQRSDVMAFQGEKALSGFPGM